MVPAPALYRVRNTRTGGGCREREAGQQKEEQVLEWMIYLILEHIPRPLYAVNMHGKTIFYNSHFEDLYRKKFKKDVDVEFVEQSLKDGDKNELLSGKKSDELVFFNRDLKIHYEKIPLHEQDAKRWDFYYSAPWIPMEKAAP